MKSNFKDQKRILEKLNIEALNEMQLAAIDVISNHLEIVLLSPTGTGKTLAYALPLIQKLNRDIAAVQLLILVPSRELAIQIEQVIREMGTGYKVNAIYGGRPIKKDFIELAHEPTILIGTPGRIADHLRRETFLSHHIQQLVLDEFDKSLETGFEKDMKEIIYALPNLKRRILTSATEDVEIPSFVGLSDAQRISFISEGVPNLEVKIAVAEETKPLDLLCDILHKEAGANGIVFCNYKQTISELSDYLNQRNIDHACFYGGMEQMDRERSLIKFRNGTHNILVATDLAARGVDVPELNYIVHFEIPFKETEFIHRNGRTARMNKGGIAYVISKASKQIPDFIKDAEIMQIDSAKHRDLSSEWCTVFVSGGRKDKISKGDIAGLFFKQGKIEKTDLGLIELKHDCAFVALKKRVASVLIEKLNNTRLKKKKVRLYQLE